MDIRKQFANLDLWPISALDKRKEVVTVSPCGDADIEALMRMYDTYEPKAAIQGLPPVDQNTRAEWIRSCLSTAMNLKAELGGAVVAHGMLFPMPDPTVVEFNLFVHNRTQNRGLGLIVGHLLFAAAKRLGFKKVWVFESRNNARALRIYYKVGFREARREGNELELELDLARVSETPDLSEIITPVVPSTGRVKSPDYLAGQSVMPDTRSVIIYSPRFEEFTISRSHPFITSRSRLFLDMCERNDVLHLPGTQIMEPKPIDENSVLVFHDIHYYHYLVMASRGVFNPRMLSYGIGSDDNPIARGVLEYFLLAVGASVMGADLLMSQPNVKLVFSPTGGFHHGGPNYASGFCYLNDVVIAIKYLLQQNMRVLYFDIDAHHGDGVQFAFYDEPRVLKISLHESARTLFPWNSGFENELGEGEGSGYNVNVPLAPGTEDEIYREVFRRIVAPLARSFKPDICVLAAGVDAIYTDAMSHLSLTNNIYAEVIHGIRKLVPKMLMLGAGGYNPHNIARDWTLAWAVLHDAEPESDYFGQMGGRAAAVIEGASLRDSYPFVSATKIAEARAEVRRVMTYLEQHIFPVHGLTPQPV
ncbi:MAG TPA: GNAT family N-acetyltransferase [Syntrophales bacterium]|nr:GNAT family N-acetyltransferase [Syntrophales bacterium]